jgi:metal-responsive CopG/Arc/MetJ family transcriptional regulator
MKTLRISDEVHRKLTATVGTLMAQTGKMQTYQDAIEALLKESVILPAKLLMQIQKFMEENRRLGYTTKEEFIRDAIRFRLTWHSDKYEYMEIPKDQYERLNEAIKEMNMPYRSAEDFINAHVKEALEKYETWKITTKKH